MSEKDDPRQDETTSNCPDGVSLARRQPGRRRCQGLYGRRVPIERHRAAFQTAVSVQRAQHGEAVRALLIEDFLEDLRGIDATIVVSNT
jgi:hypothetical protein